MLIDVGGIYIYPPPCVSTFGVSAALGGWGGQEVASLSLKGAPPHTPALPASTCVSVWHEISCSFYDTAFGTQIEGEKELAGRPDMQSAHACACFGEVTFSQKLYGVQTPRHVIL